MAKKRTKLDKMSKKERTSLAYALATNIAKYGRPQSPKNERKLSKGEINKREKEVKKFKKAFDLEEILSIASTVAAMQAKKDKTKKKPYKTSAEQLPPNYNPMTGKFTEKLDPVGKEDADINNDGKVDKTDDYLKNRRKTISKAIKKEAVLFKDRSQDFQLDVIAQRKYRSDFRELDYEQQEDVRDALEAELEAEDPLFEDLDLGHQDNEPHMLKKDLYRTAKYAAELYMMVNKFDNKGVEVDFPHWWQSKIIKAKDMLISAKHYLDGELKIPQIDAMLEEEMGINDPILMKLRADKMRREKEANMPKPIASKMKKNNSAKIAFLQKERERLMMDMEQEAEPEGGPIADRYGAELNRIDRAIDKLTEVKIGDELTMDDKNSPAYGKKGKVTRLTQDGVEVDFGRGDKYGIISRRIKGNKITA